MNKLMSIAAAAALTASMGVGAAYASDADTSRVGGANRYEVATSLSQFVTPGGVELPVVYVASGATFPDGLTASAQAGASGGRLLLVPSKGALPASVKDEITRLNPAMVVIAGGEASVSKGIEDQLKALTNEVKRVGGADRYEVAANLSDAALSDVAFVAAGENFPDALSGSAIAGGMDASVLLTQKGKLPAATRAVLDYDRPTTVMVLGGPGSVSDAVIADIKATLPDATVTRVGGANRYEVAANASRYGFPKGSDTVYLASGQKFPDALSAGAGAGMQNAPLLLAAQNCVPKATLAEIKRLGATQFVAVGGPATLSQNVINRVPCKN